jgi:hypothetical protein
LAGKRGRKVIVVIQTAFGFWHATTILEPKMSASPLKTACWTVNRHPNWGQNKLFPHSGVGP